MSVRLSYIAGAAALAAAVIAAVVDWQAVDFCLDDAFIHLSYAKSLRLGDGLSYNPGDWELGYSSPLWVLVLSLIPESESPWLAVKVLGVVLQAIATLFAGLTAARLFDDPLRRRWAAGIAGGLVATSPLLVQGATSGMEVPLASAALAATLWATVDGRYRVGLVLGGLAALARPETVPLVVGFSAWCWWLSSKRETRRDWRALFPAFGAVLAFVGFALYCQTIGGKWFPNSLYVKQGGSVGAGLDYLARRVLFETPWFLGVGGLVGLAACVRGRALRPAQGLIAAWIVGVLLVAVSRNLNPKILFFHSRYFAPLMIAPAIAIAAGLVSSRPRLRLVLIPVAAVAIWQLVVVSQRMSDQESDIATLHTAVARDAARRLPAEAVILVEGAGAMRYFAPRSMRIIDVIGLNAAPIAFAPDDAHRYCVWASYSPTHAVVTSETRETFMQLYSGKVLETYVEDHYGQAIEPYRRGTWLVELHQLHPAIAEGCARLGYRLDAKAPAISGGR